jgi:zinc transporter ZupT
MIQLLISQLALGVGPVVYGWLRQRPTLRRVLDALVVSSISALVILEIIPEAISEAGALVLLALAAGVVVPTILEQVLHRAESHTLENWTHRAALIAAISGLALHALLDGAALSTAAAGRSSESMLATAILIHRFPVGLSIWWLLRPRFGKEIATLTLAGMVVATFAGYAAGNELASMMSIEVVAWFQTFVAGSLLHVVFFRRHLEHE